VERQNALINAIGRRVEGLRSDRSNRWQEADLAAQTAVASIGYDKITKPETQIPGWADLSPGARITYQRLADTNNQPKPIEASQETLAQIAFDRVANPERFHSQAYRNGLAGKVPSSMLQALAAEEGEYRGRRAAQTPHPIDDGSLWRVAGPAAEAAGLFFDTIESKGNAAKAAERAQDARRKGAFLGYLREVATHWTQANPGKDPPEELKRSWVGFALREANGVRAFEANDEQTTSGITGAYRAQIVRELEAAGVPVTAATIAGFHRRAVALRGR
jgi:hypothetical protein